MRINDVEISEFSPEPGWFVAVYTEDYDLSLSGYGSTRKEAFDNLVEALYDLDIDVYKELCYQYIEGTPYEIQAVVINIYVNLENGELVYDLDDLDPSDYTLLTEQFVIEAVMPGCLDRFGLVYGNIEDEADLWKQFFEENIESIMGSV
jgi:hypothetical protein